jgi:adenylate kinase family enzyme
VGGLEINNKRYYDLARVIVIGSAGSGKTTFARDLAGTLCVAHIELDAIYWLSDWQPRNQDEFREWVECAVSEDVWVADGNYGAVRDIVWSRATTAVWLNFPFTLVFWRVLTRTIGRVFRREELFSGNRESFRAAFLSRQSLLWWVITTYRRRRRQFRTLFDTDAFPNLSLLEFKHPKQARAYQESLRNTP